MEPQGTEIARSEIAGIGDALRKVGESIAEFRKAQADISGRVESMEKRHQALVTDGDAAKQISTDYVKRLEHELDLVKNAGATTKPVVSLPGVNEGKDRFFFTRMAYGMATNDWSRAGYEKEVLDQTRALTTGLDSAAGYLLPIQVLAEMIPLLRARQVCVAAGARMLDGLSAGELTIPKKTGGATAYWVAPNTAPTESNLTVGLVTARPHTLAVHTIVEKALAQRGIPSVENMVRMDAAEVWALEFDKQALLGTGASNTPLGVQNWPSIGSQSVGSIAGAGDLDEIMDMIGTVEDANAMQGAPGFIIKPTDFRKIAKLKDTNGDYILRRDPKEGLDRRMLGQPVYESTQLTTGDFFFGNWQDLVLCEWGSLSAAASDQAGDAFLKRQIYMLLFQDVDSIVRNASSFVFCDDLAA